MAELTNWRSEKRTHNYPDGTTHRWAVVADGEDCEGTRHQVQIADWLTKDTAHLVSAAPDMLVALKAAKEWMENVTDPCGEPYNTICAAIAKAST